MNWNEKDLIDYIKRSPVSHLKYKSEKPMYDKLKNFYHKFLVS